MTLTESLLSRIRAAAALVGGQQVGDLRDAIASFLADPDHLKPPAGEKYLPLPIQMLLEAMRAYVCYVTAVDDEAKGFWALHTESRTRRCVQAVGAGGITPRWEAYYAYALDPSARDPGPMPLTPHPMGVYGDYWAANFDDLRRSRLRLSKVGLDERDLRLMEAGLPVACSTTLSREPWEWPTPPGVTQSTGGTGG